MKRKNLITISCFLVLLVVCVIPALVHHYTYPNLSDDTANHFYVIERLVNGTLPQFEFRYLGYAIIGYPLWLISKLTNVDMLILFNWLNIILPFIVGLSLYFVFSRLINWITGLLSLVIPLFVSGATIYYFYYGLIFNVVSVLVLYPLLFYFVVKWLYESKNYQLFMIIVLSIIAGTFHVSGLYLPILIGILLFIYVTFSKIKKQPLNKKWVLVGSIVLIIGVICIFVLPYTRQQFIDMIRDINGGMAHPTPQSIRMQKLYDSILPLDYFIVTFVSFPIVAFIVIGIWQIKTIWNKIGKSLLMYSLIMVIWVAVVILSIYFRFSTIPMRQQLDLAIILSLLTLVIIGVLISYNKKYLIIVAILSLFSLYPQFFPTWFQDGSALKQPDKQAIEYVKELGISSYDCSPNVSFAIYNVYLDIPYKDGADVLIMRNLPQTQGCEINNPFYDEHGRTNTDGYNLLESFDDGNIKVEIYRR